MSSNKPASGLTQSSSTGRSGFPSQGDTLMVPVDGRDKQRPDDRFSRPFLVTSVDANQVCNGFIFLEHGDSYRGFQGPGVFYVKQENTWRFASNQAPELGSGFDSRNTSSVVEVAESDANPQPGAGVEGAQPPSSFDPRDANQDGEVTKDERKAARKERQAQ